MQETKIITNSAPDSTSDTPRTMMFFVFSDWFNIYIAEESKEEWGCIRLDAILRKIQN